MRALLCLVVLSALGFPALARDKVAPQPQEFEVALHTFFDFGPPTDFYQIYLVRRNEMGSSIERVTLTPPGGSCIQPATVEVETSTLSDSPQALLANVNPCQIPEKELHREVKRCKKCLTFSGADVRLRVQCGDKSRIINTKILDRDIYDSRSKTPSHTSWSMQLMSSLDKSLGSSVSDRPVFATGDPPPTNLPESSLLKEVGAAKYDSLFAGSPDKPSDVYRMAKTPIPKPEISITLNPEVPTESLVKPTYPPIARLANIDGIVHVKFQIAQDGSTDAVMIEDGHPMLRPATEQVVRTWRFAKDPGHREVQAAISFKSNCSVPK